MLKLRRAIVVETRRAGADPAAANGAARPGESEQRLVVELAGDAGAGRRREAIADVGLVGRSEVGDEVIVNVQALDLGLGSGGFDVVHVNLTRGLDGEGARGANVMKLNYTSLQHAVEPVEREPLQLPVERPVAVLALHGQLAARRVGVRAGSPGRAAGLRADGGRSAAGQRTRTRCERCASAGCWPAT